MDWDAKMPSWDLGTVVGPTSGGGGALDLKLGGPTSWKAVAAAAFPPPPPPQQPAPSSSSAPAKRPRAGQQQAPAPACSVEGCGADLSRCREYHRRHKVCEAHSKTPVVTVAGQQQRFCQQCSRFHLLVEFDEVKRSCRKRLDGHNRRRRKPQPDPLNPGSLFANHHGVTRFSSYPQLFSTASMAEPKWPATIVKTEADTFQDQYYLTDGAASLFHGKDRKHFPFLTHHGGGDTVAGTALGFQPFTITPSSESTSKQSNSNCALSLLSDNQTPAQTMIPAPQYGNVARLPDGRDVSLTGMSYVWVGDKLASIVATSAGHTAAAAAPSPASAAATQLQYHHGYYHVGGGDQGSPDGAAIQALPFSSW